MLKIKTTKLQEMLARAIKGASNNKLLPMTSLMALELKNGVLTITTTDMTNYLYVTEQITGDDFYVCVPIDKFPKLIARLTCEDVEMDLKENYLEVKGNGTYQIEFQLDENGQMVKFPDPLASVKRVEVGNVQLSTIKAIINAIRPALATSASMPQYTNYFIGDISIGSVVMATDTFKISALKTSIFGDGESRLISSEVIDLLDTIIDDNVSIYADETKLAFVAEHGAVYGYVRDGLENFNSAAIGSYLEKEYPSECKIAKAELLNALDRIALFLEYSDNDMVEINFGTDAVKISSKKSNGQEVIPYMEKGNVTKCTGSVSLDRFRTQIKAQTGDAVDVQFGDGKSIKISDDNTILVVALGE